MPPNLFTVHKLTDKLSIIAPYGPDMSQIGGNIGVFITDEGVLVVDDNYYTQVRNGQTVELAEAVVAEIKKMTKQPIRFVINTHHHSDHAGGNPVFAKLGTIYAQKNVRNRILEGYKKSKETLDFDPVKAAPTVTYDGELIFHLGGEEIHLYHPARAHTDGDTHRALQEREHRAVGRCVHQQLGARHRRRRRREHARVAAVHRSRHSARRRERDDGAGPWRDREGGGRAAVQDVFHEHAGERAEGDRGRQDARAGDGRDYGAGVREPARRRRANSHERGGDVRRVEGGGK